MPKPVKHRERLRRLRAAGWTGPYHRGPHPFVVRGNDRLTIPNPHHGDIDWSLTKRIIQQASISVEEWDNL